MSVDIGVNFRNTVGYVTDGANETFFDANSEAYPTTHGSVTGGMTGAFVNTRDRNNALPVELAGTSFQAGLDAEFRLGVGFTGTAHIYTREGDPGGTQTSQLQVKDGNGVLFSTPSASITSGNYRDANGNINANTSLAGETYQTVTLTTNYVLFEWNNAGGTFLQSVRVVQAGAAPVSVPLVLFEE